MNLENIKFDYKCEAAKEEEIELLKKEIQTSLPDIYIELIKNVNGFVDENGIKIYGTDELIERNETFEVKEYAPGYIAIGDDSGGNVFLMKAKENEKSVISVDSGDMNPNDILKIVTEDMQKWITGGCQYGVNENCQENSINLCDVYLLGMPETGTKDLIKIKKAFGIETAMAEILAGVKNPPYKIVGDITYAKASVILRKLKGLENILEIK